MKRTQTEWLDILVNCGVADATAQEWAPIFADNIDDNTFSAGDDEIDDFLGQVLHESSNLERLEEGLSYRDPARLCRIFSSRLPTVAAAQPYVRNPQALANKVYGGRFGNAGPNDGWNYRGGGLLQVTFLDNYALVGDAIGIDLVAEPDLLRTDKRVALMASIAMWEARVPDEAMGDIVKVTKRINPALAGIADRTELTDKAREALA